MSHLDALLAPREQRRLLALDGGGIRGCITIEILAAIEAAVRVRTGRDKLVLGEWFDYVGGTSTGAIIATCVSLGMSVEEIRTFYHHSGALMFDRAQLVQRFWYTYRSDELTAMLRKPDLFGNEQLHSERLTTLLLLVMRNATTDSPWPLSNNPAATYNAIERGSNLDLPLWQLVRASTAAPTYFPPEEISLGADQPTFLFVDGGVTTYNNPAFLLFTMATLAPYRLRWQTGKERLLVISVGTGSSADANMGLAPSDMNLVYNVRKIPAALMYATLVQQDILCRMFGDCRFGAPIDLELGDLIEVPAPAAANSSPTAATTRSSRKRKLRRWTCPSRSRTSNAWTPPRTSRISRDSAQRTRSDTSIPSTSTVFEMTAS